MKQNLGGGVRAVRFYPAMPQPSFTSGADLVLGNQSERGHSETRSGWARTGYL